MDYAMICQAARSPIGQPWMWTLLFGPHSDARLRADARGGVAAFKKSWRREWRCAASVQPDLAKQ
jgi:hypothetical protein